MDKLIAGYRRFRAGTWPQERNRFDELSRLGQKPRALVIACSDSRTDPQMVFNAAPGELFVLRNVANLVPPYGPDGEPHGVSSAIEFAVRALRVPDIVVMGHAMCGGIKALLDGTPPELSDFVGPWVHIAEPAAKGHASAGRAAPYLLRARIRPPVVAKPNDLSLDQIGGRSRKASPSRLLLWNQFGRARAARARRRFSSYFGLVSSSCSGTRARRSVAPSAGLFRPSTSINHRRLYFGLKL
jgi:carbonic anhydrase